MFHDPVSFPPIEHGGLRRMTLGEVHLASSLYGYSIQYNQVWIHRGSYLPFNLQAEKYAMTPNGELYFQDHLYRDDFSQAYFPDKHLFLHEMMHVYQHQRGMWVRTRGAFSWAVEYDYTLERDQLADYPMEQQACIVSDYWLLLNHGFHNVEYLIGLKDYNPTEPEHLLIQRYQHVLRFFPA